MRIIYNAKHHYAICLKFGDKFLTSLTKLVAEAKASISLIAKFVSQRNAACNRNNQIYNESLAFQNKMFNKSYRFKS